MKAATGIGILTVTAMLSLAGTLGFILKYETAMEKLEAAKIENEHVSKNLTGCMERSDELRSHIIHGARALELCMDLVDACEAGLPKGELLLKKGEVK